MVNVNRNSELERQHSVTQPAEVYGNRRPQQEVMGSYFWLMRTTPPQLRDADTNSTEPNLRPETSQVSVSPVMQTFSAKTAI